MSVPTCSTTRSVETLSEPITGYARAGTSSPSQLSQSWSLTSVGDWSSTTINGTAHTRTHGPTHELLTNKIGSGSTQNVTHDVKGNMTSIPANLSSNATPLALTWDFDNQMKSADIDANGTADVTITYQVLGRLVTRSHSSGTWVFVQSDQQTLCDYVIGQGPSNTLYRYVYASYIDKPVVRKETGSSGSVLYYHRNQQYSNYAVTGFSGAVQERYAYTAYGQPTFLNASGSQISNSTISNRYTYTGREWDHTVGLHYFRARWMSANSGRFHGRDPIGFRSRELCLYQFLSSQSLGLLDPSGELSSTRDSGGDTKTCGSAAIDWLIETNPESAEYYVVQKICFSVRVVECANLFTQCCKPWKRRSCEVCYYEMIVDPRIPDFASGRAIDEWRFDYCKGRETTCGSNGSIQISSELRAFARWTDVWNPRHGKAYYECIGLGDCDGTIEADAS